MSSAKDHFVQFYEKEEFLYPIVADFIADGLRAGEPAVVIAIPEHRDGIAADLSGKGFDLQNVTFLDANEALATFMAGEMPDEARFRHSIGGTIAKSANEHRPSRVRAYGEMVDVLWRGGKPEAAIRLEELWNDLANHYKFSLLCAYPIGNFYKESDRKLFEEVCGVHSHVVPAESYPLGGDDDARLREISLLQQRAEALRTEIAHRKELEQAMREALAARRRAEGDLKDFLENANVAMHWVGPDGTILWANAAEMRLLGYERQEYIGRHIADFHADRDNIDDILRRLLANEVIEEREARLLAKDGSIRYVSISSSALFENGEFVHTRCFTRDITDRKHLDDERRRMEEVNGFLLTASTLLHRSLDYDTRLRDLNDLIVPRLADRCSIDIAREDEWFDSVETEFDEKQMVVPMQLGDRTLGTITFVLDQPERRYGAKDFELAVELTHRAASAIENARLYRLAQQVNRTKDEFLATLSHELRTPLTAILGWARMLTLGGLDGETVRIAHETIERSARTQATLIDDLLDLSRVVTGKLTLQTELVDLAAIVDNAVQTQRLAADAKTIRLEVAVPADRAVVTGDSTRLQQIAWNLISNAIKFSSPGGKIAIDLERDSDYARLIVRDEGRGISPDFLPHVFEPFRQADGASTRAHSGLGLGLAIVKYLTELHGGSVSASSRGEGRGATFMVTLPLAMRRSIEAAPAQRDEIVDLRGTAVLLVDDDAATRELLTATLRRCGSDVTALDSVAAACEFLHARIPDIVVTDIAMPNQDGFALLDFIRSTGNGISRVPVIALTASAAPHTDQARIREAGFHAWITKPIDPFHFARVIYNSALSLS